MSTPDPVDPYPRSKREREEEEEEKRRRDVPERPDKSRTPQDEETEEEWNPKTPHAAWTAASNGDTRGAM